MKLIMAMVMSIDAKTTKHFNPNIYTWTSTEDQKHFFNLIAKQKAIIMGSKTYESAREYIKLTPLTLRTVITSKPEKYLQEEITGQLEFKNLKPEKIVAQLIDKGYKKALLVGGSELNSSFLKAKLVNEIWLTVEPKIFGKGNMIVTETVLDLNLELLSVKKMNEKGTLLLKYKVLN